jgi:hypothetical protein
MQAKTTPVLGAFSKLRKAISSSPYLSIRLSARPHAKLFSLGGFSKLLYLSIFENLSRNFKFD